MSPFTFATVQLCLSIAVSRRVTTNYISLQCLGSIALLPLNKVDYKSSCCIAPIRIFLDIILESIVAKGIMQRFSSEL